MLNVSTLTYKQNEYEDSESRHGVVQVQIRSEGHTRRKEVIYNEGKFALNCVRH